MSKQEPIFSYVATIRYGRKDSELKKIAGGVLFGVPVALIVGGLFITHPIESVIAALVITCMAIGIRLLGSE